MRPALLVAPGHYFVKAYSSAGNLTITAKTSSVKASAMFAVAATPVPQPPVVSTDPFRFGVATPGGPLAGS